MIAVLALIAVLGAFAGAAAVFYKAQADALEREVVSLQAQLAAARAPAPYQTPTPPSAPELTQSDRLEMYKEFFGDGYYSGVVDGFNAGQSGGSPPGAPNQQQLLVAYIKRFPPGS